jgi:thiamine biosynthesis lipoprotein
MKMTRRSFLAAAALAPMGALASPSPTNRYLYHDDHVLGTSMDLAVWCSNPAVAERAYTVVTNEIIRLNAILNMRNPNSEIRRLGDSEIRDRSHDLRQMFIAYSQWEYRSRGLLSIRPAGPGTDLNVDALGKAYIIDRAAAVARRAAPAMDGMILNIGGDMVVWGNTHQIQIADPQAPQYNAPPIAMIALRNAAVATSGTYARGAHLLNARNGQAGEYGVSATVIAPDTVSANALATTLCVTDAAEGLRLVETIPGAAALRVDPNGNTYRTSGFARFERPLVIRRSVAADWPAGYQLTMSLTLTAGQSAFGGGGPFGGRAFGSRPQYVAIWVENSAGKLIRVLAFWANKPQYYRELSSFYSILGRDQNLMYSMARGTQRPGVYEFVWDGLDDQHKPVPAATYKISVETNQEHGSYGKQFGMIACADMPASLMLPKTANFEPVIIQYGPKQNRA